MSTAEIETVLADGAQASLGEDEKRTVAKFVDKIVEAGIDGVGPLESARNIAEQHRLQHVDVDAAIDRLIATHTRLVAATGFATGLGGVFPLPVTIPTDAAVLYTLSARCVAAVAHLRATTSNPTRSAALSC